MAAAHIATGIENRNNVLRVGYRSGYFRGFKQYRLVFITTRQDEKAPADQQHHYLLIVRHVVLFIKVMDMLLLEFQNQVCLYAMLIIRFIPDGKTKGLILHLIGSGILLVGKVYVLF
jgi:hypothetical protein